MLYALGNYSFSVSALQGKKFGHPCVQPNPTFPATALGQNAVVTIMDWSAVDKSADVCEDVILTITCCQATVNEPTFAFHLWKGHSLNVQSHMHWDACMVRLAVIEEGNSACNTSRLKMGQTLLSQERIGFW